MTLQANLRPSQRRGHSNAKGWLEVVANLFLEEFCELGSRPDGLDVVFNPKAAHRKPHIY
jgi:hypothetical protein